MRKTYYILLVSLVLLLSCKKENRCDCIKSSGPITNETRNVGSFNKILVEDKIEVHLTQGANYSVEVVAGDNLLSNIKTELNNGTLKIFNTNRCNWVRSYKKKIQVNVTLPNIQRITHNGLGNIYFDNTFVQDSIFYEIKNAGDIHLKLNTQLSIGGTHGIGDSYIEGNTVDNYIYINGQGFSHAENFLAQNSFLTLYTSGEVHVNTINNLHVLIARDGNVYYKGNPTIYPTIQGKGKLIQE